MEEQLKQIIQIQEEEAWMHHKLKEAIVHAENLVRLRGNDDDKDTAKRIKQALLLSLYSPSKIFEETGR